MRKSRSVIKDGAEKMFILNGLGQAAIQDLRFGKIHQKYPHAYIHTPADAFSLKVWDPLVAEFRRVSRLLACPSGPQAQKSLFSEHLFVTIRRKNLPFPGRQLRFQEYGPARCVARNHPSDQELMPAASPGGTSKRNLSLRASREPSGPFHAKAWPISKRKLSALFVFK